MQKLLEDDLKQFRGLLYPLFREYLAGEHGFLLRSDLVEPFARTVNEAGTELEESTIAGLLEAAQEAVVAAPSLYFALRPSIGSWQYLHVDTEAMAGRFITVSEFLAVKERLIETDQEMEDWVLEIDLEPFERGFPRLKETRSIGKGVEYLNRHLSSQLFGDLGKGDQGLFDFLRLHHRQGRQLMLNPAIGDLEGLSQALRKALDWLDAQPDDQPWKALAPHLQRLGFEPGWGCDAATAAETMQMLLHILEAPGPQLLEAFLARLPMIFTIVILSPHGYFGQSRVLGKPDTGGQVVYILDQVRALEKEMIEFGRQQGLEIEPRIVVLTRLIPEADDTTANQRIEPIHGTEQAMILRVPFRSETGEVIPHWISRFDLWPCLEQFAHDAEKELMLELGRRPDLLIGNYSDGNLVATLLSRRLGVTQCNIAHALEKTKYLHSDLYWKDHEPEHHFSCQFTADLIAMNTADFIITSTYQEIAGTRTTIGQYESYRSYTLPGLYRVRNGVDVFDPKFNIVSPGADPDIFFPYTETDRRIDPLRDAARDLVHGDARPDARGRLRDPDKPALFVMSRLDHIKNVTGLVTWYGECEPLRAAANLFIAGGFIDPARSGDSEEQDQIRILHELMDRYQLDDQVRWVEMQTEKAQVGELYRTIADTRGAFVQPALFEAFGLTVVEAMASGLPVFATRYGGPLEIIEDGTSGFHIDPNHGDHAALRMAEFFEECAARPEAWDEMSGAAVERIESRYTWKQYARRLLTLSRIYGFWKYISNIEREETGRYLEMFYGLMYKPLADGMNHGSAD